MKKHFTCKLFGHQLQTIKKDSILIKEYECKNCKEKFTVDGYGQIVKLSKYWQQNNAHFEKLFQNKRVI